ncbi:hypothetical protein NDU88_000648 [Pleurodeles waltl]|uniref:C-type lectin domain-containing protein n=1 Tax=Pleurodeles waltl TaxID=8319 RepID=A0AAV7P332_PLEWA|nr:hypothetical protein NDU88_000648 [Pleurodeles waltl]
MGAPEERALAEPPELVNGGCVEGTKHKRTLYAVPDPGCPGRVRTALTRVRRLRAALALAAALSVAVAGLALYVTEQPQAKGAQSSTAETAKDGEGLPPCGDGWIWYRNKCFYFSEDEGDWTEAKDSCAALNSSLALIDTQKELDFMLRYKGTRYHWIGLQRESNQQWKWVNGTEFNNWFVVADYSECAYLGHDRVKGVECYSKCKWICTQGSAYG